MLNKIQKASLAKCNEMLKMYIAGTAQNTNVQSIAKSLKVNKYSIYEMRARLVKLDRIQKQKGHGNYVLLNGSDIREEEYLSTTPKGSVAKKKPEMKGILTAPIEIPVKQSESPSPIIISGTPAALALFIKELRY